MIPVLSVRDPDQACAQLERQFGFVDIAGLMRFGDAAIKVVASDAALALSLDLRPDHVAFGVGNVDEVFRGFANGGAVLDRRFTPAGPRDIPEFWEHGVRFVFFEGPESSPLEFCAKAGPDVQTRQGHDHFGIRTADLDAAEARLTQMGAVPLARYALPGEGRVTHVRFLRLGRSVFELFDEPPLENVPEGLGWIGFCAD